MNIDEAIASQCTLIKKCAQGISDAATLHKSDKGAMSECFTMSALVGTLLEMLYDRSEGKTEW